jgi:hypothetical protein
MSMGGDESGACNWRGRPSFSPLDFPAWTNPCIGPPSFPACRARSLVCFLPPAGTLLPEAPLKPSPKAAGTARRPAAGRQPDIPSVLVQQSVGQAILDALALRRGRAASEEGSPQGSLTLRLSAAPEEAYAQMGAPEGAGSEEQPAAGEQLGQCPMPAEPRQHGDAAPEQDAAQTQQGAGAGSASTDTAAAGRPAEQQEQQEKQQHGAVPSQSGDGAAAAQDGSDAATAGSSGAKGAQPVPATARLELLVPPKAQPYILEKVYSQQMDLSLVFKEVFAVIGINQDDQQQQQQQQGRGQPGAEAERGGGPAEVTGRGSAGIKEEAPAGSCEGAQRTASQDRTEL